MAIRPEDNLLGKLAVAFGFVSPEQLEECVRVQRETKEGVAPFLGSLLLEKGFLERDELRDLLEFQKEKLSSADTRKIERENDRMFGYLAMKLELVSAEQVRSAVEHQSRLSKFGLRFRLGEVMVQDGLLTQGQVADILRRQTRFVIVCPACEKRHVAFDREPGEAFECSCGRKLEVQD